jgi:hypothetical protein
MGGLFSGSWSTASLVLYIRECLVLEVAKKFTGEAVAKLLTSAGLTRGQLPEKIRVDNGTEFTSKALDLRAYWSGVILDFRRPGEPSGSAFAVIEYLRSDRGVDGPNGEREPALRPLACPWGIKDRFGVI